MVSGQLVTVKLYGGRVAQRRVVAVKDDVIVICAEQEYKAAERERGDCRVDSAFLKKMSWGQSKYDEFKGGAG